MELVNAPSGSLRAAGRQPVRRRTSARVVRIGEVRLPLAGPYRPRARLFRLPDGHLVWHVRLWEYDRVVPHIVGTDTIRRFALQNRLVELLHEVDRLVLRALGEPCALW